MTVFIAGIFAGLALAVVGATLYPRFSKSFREWEKLTKDSQAHIERCKAEGVCYGCGAALTDAGAS